MKILKVIQNTLIQVLAIILVLSNESTAELQTNTVIDSSTVRYVFRSDNNYPPYYFEQDGEIIGFCVDLIHRIAELMDFDVEIIGGPWSEVRRAVETGEADGVLAMFYSEERDRKLDFSIPHSSVIHAIFVHDESPVYSRESLAGKSIVVQNGDIMHDWLLQNKITDKIITVENPEDAMLLLSHGTYDCALLGRMQGEYFINKYKLENIHSLSETFPPREFCFAVYQDQHLLNMLNDGLSILQADGEHKQLYQKWLESESAARFDLGAWYEEIISYIILSVILAIAAFFWIWSLRKTVSLRTRALEEEIKGRSQVEEALRASEENFRALAENAFDGILINNQNGDYVYANSNAAEISGYPVSVLTKLNVKDLTPPDNISEVLDLSKKRIKGKPVRSVYESLLLHKDGTIIPIEVVASQTRWLNEPADMVFIRDISLRKQMEKALQSSESNFRQIVEHSNDAIYVRQNGSFVLINPALQKLLEYEKDELLDQQFDFMTIVANRSRDYIRSRIEKRRKHQSTSKQYEFTARSKSGKILELEVNTSKIIWNKKPASLGIIRDLTRYKRMQEEAFKSEKLDSVGILAGGIAHDFNNILSVLLGNVQLSKMKASKGEDIKKYLNSLEETISRATGLTQQLLTFSKGGEPVIEVASLRDLLEEIVPFSLTGSNIKADLKIEEDLFPVEMDSSQVSQVFTNIIINAKQAMPNGGNLYVEAINVVVESGDLIKELDAGEYVKISIRDEGIGIPDKIIDKIFDPFFSTKSSGSGLGLATCYSIVRKHRGHITVDSETGEGTTFTIYLPGTEKQLPVKKASESSKSFSGRVLLMDDEDSVRDFVSELLTELGFSVDSVSDGQSALKTYTDHRANAEYYDLVILDLTIPGGKGGKEVLADILKINPDVIALAYSGYADDPVISHPKEYGFKASISKPFDLDKLMAVISSILK